METVKRNITDREIYITLLCTIGKIIPKDVIKYIMWFNKDGEDNLIDVKFSIGIKKIFKEYNIPLHGTISTVKFISSLMNALIEKIIRHSIILMEHCRTHTITSREVQNSIRCIGSGMCREFIHAGTVAVTRYNANRCEKEDDEDRKSKKITSTEKQELPDTEKKKRVRLVNVIRTKTEPSKVEKMMRHYIKEYDTSLRLSVGGTIYLTAVIDIIIHQIIEGAINLHGSLCTEHVINSMKSDIDIKTIYYELFI